MFGMRGKLRGALMLLPALVAGLWLAAGCTSLCNKRLYLHRDVEQKSLPASQMALLIADPGLAKAIMAGATPYLQMDFPWAADQPAHQSDAYQLSIERLDDKMVFQGLCMDTLPTYACEVRPGPRQVLTRLDLFGAWGHEKFKKAARLTLEPGACYFLRPDWEAMRNKQFILKVERLSDAYTPDLRSRLIDRERRNTKANFTMD